MSSLANPAYDDIEGIRAEMAYHKLKQAGYNVGFLYAALDVKKDGTFKVTAN